MVKEVTSPSINSEDGVPPWAQIVLRKSTSVKKASLKNSAVVIQFLTFIQWVVCVVDKWYKCGELLESVTSLQNHFSKSEGRMGKK
mmetsp:Transcript_464/g.793  ORF Transcript_464/g.793 Transcript_464/m.793 type:complete len:86 (+) Transcript_464:139-396(+)